MRRSFDDGDITPTNDMICEHIKIQSETRYAIDKIHFYEPQIIFFIKKLILSFL